MAASHARPTASLPGSPALRLVEPAAPLATAGPRWALGELAGRVVELVAGLASAPLTQALALVREAQVAAEPAAWVTLQAHAFFAPDAAAGGVDLRALPVVRARDAAQAGRAADKLLRSGAFGLVVVDLLAAGRAGALPSPLLARLASLARAHQAVLLLLTPGPGLGSLVSLRVESLRWRGADGPVAELRALKDRRHGPGWQQRLPCAPPPGWG